MIYLLLFWIMAGSMEGTLIKNGGNTGKYVIWKHFNWYHVRLSIAIILSEIPVSILYFQPPWIEYWLNNVFFEILWFLPCLMMQDLFSYLSKGKFPIPSDWTFWPFNFNTLLPWWYYLAGLMSYIAIRLGVY